MKKNKKVETHLVYLIVNYTYLINYDKFQQSEITTKNAYIILPPPI